MTRHTINPILFFLLFTVILASGCNGMPFTKSDADVPQPLTTRHTFEDIAVPSELKIDEGQSFVFETAAFKAGTLYFTGYVDVDSLKNYFVENMPKDGWRLKSIFRFPKIVLLYEKSNKVCIIEIFEKTFMTQVEIWVAPVV
jgi:hypothetical protein